MLRKTPDQPGGTGMLGAAGAGRRRGPSRDRGGATALAAGGAAESRRGPSRGGDVGTGRDGLLRVRESESGAGLSAAEAHVGKGEASSRGEGQPASGARHPSRSRGRRAPHPVAVKGTRDEASEPGRARGGRSLGRARGAPTRCPVVMRNRAQPLRCGEPGRRPGRRGGAGERLTVRGVLDVVVELAVAAHLDEEHGDGGHAEPGERAQREGHLPTHLVLCRAAGDRRQGQKAYRASGGDAPSPSLSRRPDPSRGQEGRPHVWRAACRPGVLPRVCTAARPGLFPLWEQPCSGQGRGRV